MACALRWPLESSYKLGWRTVMKALLGAVLFGITLIIIPVALVSLPAAAVDETEPPAAAADIEPGWAACGMALECLR
jgi:hypothetical protein